MENDSVFTERSLITQDQESFLPSAQKQLIMFVEIPRQSKNKLEKTLLMNINVLFVYSKTSRLFAQSALQDYSSVGINTCVKN